ncbi:hypothetical protein [Aeromicrobium sp. Leaf350]|uniref:hypothetical protein n=1 Tax=Aeromicrobium sp. Leaf350 TaxID=2876565 RepID=UPI001E403E8D|nr:hypothetical protein [Aeromicrobium sp. Leaf350]
MSASSRLHSWVVMLCVYASVWVAAVVWGVVLAANRPSERPEIFGYDDEFLSGMMLVVGLPWTVLALLVGSAAVRWLQAPWGPVVRGFVSAGVGAGGGAVLLVLGVALFIAVS